MAGAVQRIDENRTRDAELVPQCAGRLRQQNLTLLDWPGGLRDKGMDAAGVAVHPGRPAKTDRG